MDAPLPDDFDVNRLEDPMQQPRKRKNEREQSNGSLDDNGEDVASVTHIPIPMPESLKKKLFAGSCCTGVAVLYLITSWDHGLIPNVRSQFAVAEDLKSVAQKVEKHDEQMEEVLTLQIAQAIRDLSKDNCTAQSPAIYQQIEALQYRYMLITRSPNRYPTTECRP